MHPNDSNVLLVEAVTFLVPLLAAITGMDGRYLTSSTLDRGYFRLFFAAEYSEKVELEVLPPRQE